MISKIRKEEKTREEINKSRPDGVFVYSGSLDKTVKKWEASSGRCLSTFLGNTSNACSIFASPDADFVYSDSHDNKVKKWEDFEFIKFDFNNICSCFRFRN